jgi:N-acetylneuraminic acid mutarotase
MKITKSLIHTALLVALLLGGVSVQPSRAASNLGTWATKTNMPLARNAMGVALASDSMMYVAGGYNAGFLSSVDVYDPATATWAAAATAASMSTPRSNLSLVALGTKLYAIGGMVAMGTATNVVEEYDLAGNTWTAMTPMPTARHSMGVAVSNSKIYVMGGSNGVADLATVEEFDPATNTWATMASMPTARVYLGAAAGPTGKIYAMGGLKGSTSRATVEEFDPSVGTLGAWTTKASMPTARQGLSAALTSNGRIYAIGGYGSADLATVEEYDPATNTWAAMANMPTARRHLKAATATVGGVDMIYAFGGATSASPALAVLEAYTPASSAAPTYTITGTVTIATGSLPVGMTISAGVGVPAAVDATTGVYTLTGLVSGTYTLTPSPATGYAFTPATRSVTVTGVMSGQDFLLVPTYTLSGHVDLAGSGLPGVNISTGVGYQATTDASGDFSILVVPEAPLYTLTPSLAGYSFTPATQTVTNLSSNVVGLDFSAYSNQTPVVTAVSGFANIHVSWTASSYATLTGYQVRRATPTAQSAYAVVLPTQALTVYDDSPGLTRGQNYCYIVDVMDGTTVVASTLPVCAIYGQANLWVPALYGVTGDGGLIVPINIQNAAGFSVASADIWLDYDPVVLTCKSLTGTSMSVGFQWQLNCATPGRVKISTFASPAKTITGDGSLFWLIFGVNGANGSSSLLTLTPFVSGIGGSSIFSDPGNGSLVDVPLALTSGSLTVQLSGALGDVDGDGVVNSPDAYLALQISVGTLTPTSMQRAAADVNGDGVINSADVSMILYYAANGSWPVPPAGASLGQQLARVGAAASVITIDSVSRSLGGLVTTALRGENLQDWAGGDFVLTLDPDFVAAVTDVSAAGMAASSPLRYRYTSDGKLRVSMARSEGINGNGVLATITLRLAPDAAPVVSPLVLADVRLHDPYGRDFVFSVLQGSITKQNGSVKDIYMTFLPSLSH